MKIVVKGSPPIQRIDEIIKATFGLWISSLFSAISGFNPEMKFEDQKEAFFWLIEHLLQEGKIKFWRLVQTVIYLQAIQPLD